jgi:hypothetical protein
MQEPKKCHRCKCRRTEYTRDPNVCDQCFAWRRAAYLKTKADPEKHAKLLEQKREARKRAKQRHADWVAQLREIKVDLGPEAYDYIIPEKPTRRIPPEVIAEMVRRYEQGESTTDIAKATGRNAGGVYSILKHSGVKFRSRPEATSMAIRQWHDKRREK